MARISRGSATPQPQRPKHSPVWGFPSIYAYILRRRTTEFGMVTHTGSELVLGVSHASHPKGQSLRALRFWGFCIYAIHHLTSTFGKVTHVEEGVFLGVNHASRPKAQCPSAPQLFGVLIHLCLRPLTQNDHVRQRGGA